MTAPSFDWLIRGGRVIDPANNVDEVADVAIRSGRIAAVGSNLDPSLAKHVYDARGKYVVPGLVDLHVHGFPHVTPTGIDVDEYCLRRGVTTAVDAGSAGYYTFPGFRAFAVEQFKTRLLAFVHIGGAGLVFAGLGGDAGSLGELDLLTVANVDQCVACGEENRDIVVGVKIRLSASCAADGRHEAEGFRRAEEAARQLGLPLMTHHSFSTVPLEDCPGNMKAGDIYTHCFHGFPSTIIDPETRRVHPVVKHARQEGVLMDIGNGQGSFTWTAAEIALGEGFLPDTISTDLHSGCAPGPAYDLPTVMTRLLHLGMSMQELVERTTINPARAIGWDDRIGTLGVGREADVTVLAVHDVDVELEDCQSQRRRIKQRIVADAVWRAGERFYTTLPDPWPNPTTIARQLQRGTWQRLVIRDDTPPPEVTL